MNIHQKINERQAKVIQNYLDLGLCSLNYGKAREMFRVPRNQTYGGYRNGCYDIRGIM